MAGLKSSFARSLQKSRLMNAFVRNAGKIASVMGVVAAPLLTLNRSFMSGHIVLDAMTMSGLALIASSAVLLPADRWPVLKRASGAFGLLYIGLLLADAWGKQGAVGLAANCTLATAACLGMMFERNDAVAAAPALESVKNDDGSIVRRAWNKAVHEFKEAPVFWTAAVSVALKPFSIFYGLANHEDLFLPYTLASLFENVSVGLMDNKVRRFFGVGAQSVPEPEAGTNSSPRPE